MRETLVRLITVDTTKPATEALGKALVQSLARPLRALSFTLERGRGVSWILLLEFQDDRAHRLFVHQMGKYIVADEAPPKVTVGPK